MSDTAIRAILYHLVTNLRLDSQFRRKETVNSHRPYLKSISGNQNGQCPNLHSFGEWQGPVDPPHIKSTECDRRQKQKACQGANGGIDTSKRRPTTFAG